MPSTLSLTRVRWIQINHRDVLFLDFSHAVPEESLALIDAFRLAMDGREPRSVLLLTDVTAAVYEPAIATRWKAARVTYAPMIRASAIFGLSGLVGMAVRGVIDAARLLGVPVGDNHLRIFEVESDATAWLGQQ
jgi:hypothetical protein